MKIYLASTAPGNEQQHKHGMLLIINRLISYYSIMTKMLENDKLFESIKRFNK